MAAKNSSDFHYLGHAMKFWNVIYNWADAGYVLSKGTLDKMMQKFDSDEACDKGVQGRPKWRNGRLAISIFILYLYALSFYRSKMILDHPNCFGRVQIILVRFKLDFCGLTFIIWTCQK